MALEVLVRETIRTGSFPGQARDRENSMLDLIILALGLSFFAAAIGYTYICERL
jgi:hypothetical protein